MTSDLRIGIAGLGTVGGGVVKMLASQQARIADATGRNIRIVAVSARDKNRHRGITLEGCAWFSDPRELAASPDVDVVIEVIGGADGVARELVESALKAGKHVVTANKALLAQHGHGLADLAERKGVALNYEAAVAGGIPIVKTVRETLAAENISSIRGILNGTCNYILTEMDATGRNFDDVLKDAQALGYAEADPSFDIGGIDAAHKLALLTSLAFGVRVDFDAVYVEGIEQIRAIDIRFAREFGYRIKLLGVATQTEDGIEQRVSPVLIPESAPLAAVSGVFNAVMVRGSFVGPLVLEGRGAGEGPTASAVVADLVDIARGNIVRPFGVAAANLKPAVPPRMERHQGTYYLRLNALDRAGSMAEITKAIAEANVSIERIVQRKDPASAAEGRLPVVFITHETDEATMRKAMVWLSEHEAIAGTPVMIRIENE